MIKNRHLIFIFCFSLFLTGCYTANISQLEATNQALSDQVNTQSVQLTQQAGILAQPDTEPAATSTVSVLPTVPPPPPPTSQPSQSPGEVAPTLIVSGSGEITPWTNTTPYAMGLSVVANVHLVCDPSDTAGGKIWIDTKNYAVNCNPNSESWVPWKQDITVGNHYIY
ncbi:MAG: hypothetical protein A2136_08865 [Chloroflexi bacterium RBG_16_54_11]|nr:MAG: hypothetical protein A2136_08865 [Chloroflexi bacterium RBG_16_54_11]